MAQKVKDIVWKRLAESPSIRIDLSRGIINVRALAKHIQRDIPGASLDAVISSIRRFEEEFDFEDLQENVMKVIKGSTLSSKNKIASVMLKKDEVTMNAIPEIFKIARTGTLRFVHTQKSIKLLFDEEFLDEILKIVHEDKIIQVEKGMGEVVVSLSKEVWNTPGVLWKLTSELFLHGINICEALTCIPEIIFIFKEDKLMDAYNVLHGLT